MAGTHPRCLLSLKPWMCFVGQTRHQSGRNTLNHMLKEASACDVCTMSSCDIVSRCQSLVAHSQSADRFHQRSLLVKAVHESSQSFVVRVHWENRNWLREATLNEAAEKAPDPEKHLCGLHDTIALPSKNTSSQCDIHSSPFSLCIHLPLLCSSYGQFYSLPPVPLIQYLAIVNTS